MVVVNHTRFIRKVHYVKTVTSSYRLNPVIRCLSTNIYIFSVYEIILCNVPNNYGLLESPTSQIL